MNVVLSTRFSIVDPTYKAWRHTSESARVLHPERLELKFAVFEILTFPSVLHQTHSQWSWLIAAGKTLPESYKQRLRSLCGKDRRIRLAFVSDMAEYHRLHTQMLNSPFVSVRLDDDDGLHPDTFKTLVREATVVGSVLAFSRFVRVARRDGVMVRAVGEEYKTDQVVAIGCAGVGFDIMLESHAALTRTRKVTFIDAFPQILFCDALTDTGRPLGVTDTVPLELQPAPPPSKRQQRSSFISTQRRR